MEHHTCDISCFFNLTPPVNFEPRSLAHELQAIGYDGLAERCFSRLSAVESRSFGQRLVRLANWLRQTYQSVPERDRPKGAGHGFEYNAERDRWQATRFTPFEEVVDTIERGGEWFKGQCLA